MARGIAPRDDAVVSHYSGNDVGKRTVFRLPILRGRNQPAREKRRDTEVVLRRVHEELRVARSSQTLVTLRTIGRNFEIIAFLSPNDVVKKLIQIGVRRREISGARHRGVNHNAFDAFDLVAR
jgi:hypothetical protein